MYFFRPVFKVVLQFLYGSLILLDGDLLYNVVHLIELVLVSLPNSIDTQFILHIEFMVFQNELVIVFIETECLKLFLLGGVVACILVEGRLIDFAALLS